jgi:hypothetical protein
METSSATADAQAAVTTAPTTSPKGLDPTVKGYHLAFQIALEYARLRWELASRLYALWRGKLPDELQGTFSKIMLNVAHSIVRDRIPKLHENLFARDDSPTLEPEEPLYELFRGQAEAWLRHKMNHPSELNMPGDFLRTTLPSACVFGTAYRMPYVCHVQDAKGKWQPVINSRHIDFYQIMPAPNGGLVNPVDRYTEDCLDHFFHVDWWTDEQVKQLEKYEGFRKQEATALFATKPVSQGEFDRTFEYNFNVIGGVSFGGTKEDWRVRMNDIEGVSGRRRVVTWYQRDRMSIIAQDRFLIYQGPNPMPSRMLPLVTYYTCPDLTNFFGISGLEMVEDIIRAMLMNFNFRMDYLAQVMFPAKWIRSDVMGGKPLADFQDRPYAVHEFPTGVDIKQALFIDRMPEVTPQTFQDEVAMKTFLQEIYGLSDYSRGMPGRLSDNRTATGLVTLVQQAQGALMSESFMLERYGLAQEARMLLAMASKWILEDGMVRVNRPDGGFVWATVEAQALADKYTVNTHGTRYMQQRDQSFQRLMALYPMWNQDPYVDQFELRRQTAEAAGVFTDLSRLIYEPQAPMAEGESAMMPGQQMGAMNPMRGMSGQMTPNNRSQRAPRITAGNSRQPANRTF